MRNRVKCVMLAILIVAIVSCMVFAQVDAPQRSKDLRDFLEQPPNNVYQEFGYSEETLLLYNIIANRERWQKADVIIKSLQAQVAALETESRASNIEQPALSAEPADPKDVN